MEVEEEIQSEVENAAAAKAGTDAEPTTDETVVADSEPTVETEQPAKDDFYKNQYENLQKDYTRKSQRLAELEKTKSEVKEPDPEWTKPEWQPKTWQEAIEAGKQAALREVAPALSEYQQAKQQREFYAQAQAGVDAELAELKLSKDEENATFLHANKYGFSSLKAAHQNLLDMRGLAKSEQQKVLKNLKIREADAVGVSGATSVEDDTPSYQEISGYKNIRSAASAALRSLQGK